MSGAKRRLFDKNDVLNVTVTKLLKSKFDRKESIYQSDTSFVELIVIIIYEHKIHKR